jgi:hypothetical protein
MDYVEKIVEGFKLLYEHEFYALQKLSGTVKLVLSLLLLP